MGTPIGSGAFAYPLAFGAVVVSNPSTGVISGEPTSVGTFGVTITGRDSKEGSAPGVFSFSWTINAPTVATVPDLSGDGVSQAQSDLASSFLQLSSVSTVVDSTCNNIGLVIRQSPRAGTQVAPESAVNITIGARPSHPCP